MVTFLSRPYLVITRNVTLLFSKQRPPCKHFKYVFKWLLSVVMAVMGHPSAFSFEIYWL